jgi:hypothetical protein
MVGMGFNVQCLVGIQGGTNQSQQTWIRVENLGSTWGQEERSGVVNRIVDAKGRVKAGTSKKRRRRTPSVQVQVEEIATQPIL